jgi:putative Holliday junction resolvase
MPSGHNEITPAENHYAYPFSQFSCSGGREDGRDGKFLNSGMTAIIPSGTLLAFDFGTKRIGIAVGNTVTATSRPLTTINDEKNELRFAAIAALLAEWQPVALVVGLPCNDDGTPHEMTALCRRFANRLKGRFNLPTLLVDERYTSAAASSVLDGEGIHGRKQKILIDQYAAQQILQAYFDEPSAGIFA